MTPRAAAFWERLGSVESRLIAHAPRDIPTNTLTTADPATGEQWEAGQVWAHVVEFVPYWLGEVRHVVDQGGSDPVPFGRTKSDPERIAAIERDRGTDRSALWSQCSAASLALRIFLLTLPESAWRARGRHPTLGDMDLATIIDEFLVGHLEQHADQLDELAAQLP
jgi:hypothetical protein